MTRQVAVFKVRGFTIGGKLILLSSLFAIALTYVVTYTVTTMQTQAEDAQMIKAGGELRFLVQKMSKEAHALRSGDLGRIPVLENLMSVYAASLADLKIHVSRIESATSFKAEARIQCDEISARWEDLRKRFMDLMRQMPEVHLALEDLAGRIPLVSRLFSRLIEGMGAGWLGAEDIAFASELDALGQRIAKAAFAYWGGDDGARQELAELNQLVSEIITGLLNGSEELGLEGVESPAVRQQLEEIREAYRPISQDVDLILSRVPEVRSAAGSVSRLNAQILEKINRLTDQLTQEAVAKIDTMIHNEWVVLGWVLLLGMLASLLVARRITGPLGAVVGAARRVGAGDLEARARLSSKDELGLLGASFNEMAQNLSDSQQHLKLAKEAAEAASKSKSEFLSHMSHELRTPLNSVIGFSEILRDESFGALNPKQKEYVTDVLESGRHLLSLINDILDLAKVEAGKLELELEEVNVREVVESAITIIKERALKQGLKLSASIADSVGGLRADKRKLKQILFNLLSNATKFTPEGGRISIEAGQRDTGTVIFSVRDTGIGIEEKDRHKVFAEFEQIDSAYSRKYAGTGLGMPLAKKLVELHGGELWFESEGKDKGTCFSFALPVKGPAGANKGEVSRGIEALVEAGPLPHTGRGNRILVIEDDPKAAKLISALLSKAGYQVQVAQDGVKGFDLAKKARPDLVTLDVMLPKKDGWEVLTELKKDQTTQAIPVLMISTMGDRTRSRALGAADTLTKPVSKNDLLREVHRALGEPCKKAA
ncbi:MAG: response regulator [Candidatus Omnitrophica bacterium]|nr:response regulator [Candidatus Omnitrophota bacterium]